MFWVHCSKDIIKTSHKHSFVRFPFSKPSVLKQWLDNIGRDDFQPRKHMVICSLHFTPDCFSGLGNRKNLLWNAVPTLFAVPTQNANVSQFTDVISNKCAFFSISSLCRQQNNSRKRLKRALQSAADELDSITPDGLPLFTEEMHEDTQDCTNNEEADCQSTKVNLLSCWIVLNFCAYIY